MTKIEPIDPASTRSSLEIIHNYLDRAIERSKNIQTKDDDKYTHTAGSIISMEFGGRFPTSNEMSIDENGELTPAGIEAIELIMSTAEWQKRALAAMGASRQSISLLWADLSGNIQATKAKQAFIDMPREVLNNYLLMCMTFL